MISWKYSVTNTRKESGRNPERDPGETSREIPEGIPCEMPENKSGGIAK